MKVRYTLKSPSRRPWSTTCNFLTLVLEIPRWEIPNNTGRNDWGRRFFIPLSAVTSTDASTAWNYFLPPELSIAGNFLIALPPPPSVPNKRDCIFLYFTSCHIRMFRFLTRTQAEVDKSMRVRKGAVEVEKFIFDIDLTRS